MNVKDYQKLSTYTCADLDNCWDNEMHMLMGMMTEVGELVDVYKKYLAYQKPFDLVNIQEEIGDLMWYIVNFCTMHNFELEDILQKNYDKLKTRYPGPGFNSYNAKYRNLKKEKEALGEK